MGHFLKACKIFDDMLPADTMYTKGIRVDERESSVYSREYFYTEGVGCHSTKF